MSWLNLNESLTKLKGQITTFATDVLQDINEGASSSVGDDEGEPTSSTFGEEVNLQTPDETFDNIETIEDVHYLHRIITQQKAEFTQKLDLLDSEHHENMVKLVSDKHQIETEHKTLKSAWEKQKKELETIYSSLKYECEQKQQLEELYKEKTCANEQLLIEIEKLKTINLTEDGSKQISLPVLQEEYVKLKHEKENQICYEKQFKEKLAENENLLSQLVELKSENEKLSQVSHLPSIEKCKKCHENLPKEHALTQTNENVEETNLLRNQIIDLQNDKDTLSKSLEDYKTKLATSTEEYSSLNVKYEEAIAELQSELQSLKEQSKKSDTVNLKKYEDMSTEFSNQQTVLIQLQGENEHLKRNNECLQLDNTKLNKSIEDHITKYKSLQQMVEECRLGQEVLEGENYQLKENVQGLVTQKEQLEKTLGDYQDKLQKYEEKVQISTEERDILKSLEVENNTLKTKIEELEIQNAQLQEKVAQYIVKINEYESESEKVSQEKNVQIQLENENVMLKMKVEQILEENEETKNKIADYILKHQNYDQVVTQNNLLKNEIETITHQNTQLQQTVEDLRKKLQDYEIELDTQSTQKNIAAKLLNDNEVLKSEMKEMKIGHETTEKILLEKTDILQRMLCENETLKCRIKDLELEKVGLIKSLEENKNSIDTSNHILSESLKDNTILDLQNEIDLLIKKLESLETENEDLSKNLLNLKTERMNHGRIENELEKTQREIKNLIENNESLKTSLLQEVDKFKTIESEKIKLILENDVLKNELVSAKEMKQSLHVIVVHILNFVRNLSNTMSTHIDALESNINNIEDTRNELKNFIKYWDDKCASLENANNLNVIVEKELEILAKHINFILYVLKNSQVDLKSILDEKSELETSLSSLLDLSKKFEPPENRNIKSPLSLIDSIKFISEKLNMDNLKENLPTLSSEDLKKLKDENNHLKEKCESLSATLLEEQSNNQHLMKEKARLTEQESVLTKNLERLQAHLIEVEEHYTQELLQTEEKHSALQKKVKEIEESETNYSNLYKSVSIRSNQKLETLQSQSQLLMKERDNLKRKLLDAEIRNEEHVAALTNLHNVLEQFQKDKDQEIKLEAEKIRKQVVIEIKVQDELRNEIDSLKQQLEQSKQGLYAASRLSDQLESSQQQVALLKDEIASLQHRLSETEAALTKKSEDKVEKTLIKNLIISAFSYNKEINKNQDQILRIIGHVLDFTQDDNTRLFNQREPSSWLKLFGPSRGPDSHDESLAQEFVKFLQSESNPREVKPFSQVEPKPNTANRDRKPSNASILSDIALPTFGNFAENRSSGSILKDVLKENR